ncbi:YajQ family cyclic di-GMP-binding protein [Halieaceae bacterium IMCC14734]|uniref:Nucleotide-binding protein EYC98_15975 n=1 Tax=Candidatus Litorirhabdus singularis TaxID=2518993 RepID=A0ABT3TJ58_9GAMM|nr:YajQ family cyclic di-GMP-binding protein [Candidatus Litorirhabdus singularis]MCX2982362.1 YajQ family cyclic di-GMP-binding protein [Candidatus Litorirhabdus singularis]
MPSFDIVSEVDLHQLTNAVDQAARIVANRFDFKGVGASFERDQRSVVLTADADFQVEQMQDMLRSTLIKCELDPKAMELGDITGLGKQVKQVITLRHGLDSPTCKTINKAIKETKFKVQSQIQDQQVRVTGKKRDELQQIMAQLRELDLEYPLQFTNFRD